MSMIDANTEHQAVTRLFELSSQGDVDNLEFAQLDALIYQRLQQTYHVSEADRSGERMLPLG
ncbi:hypothetical protein E2F46_14915 [Luteimonas aestuarii]|uniref:Uncharacterized protein n=1 Tax=Luteimonas aestuarii TaxID=453837 RepID=A0A4R5TQ20_9GAMM|nr:hypothetical protein [Luteimonas aestuarii]TDK21522.1 hypothetical protein E2F46_14915 [Luteimonas aestuarii]